MNYFLQAALHLRHVLELKPNYGPALSALADMEAIPDTSVHLYTVVIIVFLVAAVLILKRTFWEVGYQLLCYAHKTAGVK